ncbi:hypothetical protein THAOC_04905 [Thalassiosira oceanica]|uniref:Uncharacterized protein n=1 Tax=Thalassiosira oceanica TaxID=159749 RepID=K0T430_THAOC|nr:hypothetical protein THAOC_04905 [Thalassiosira oceanica]|eukprot:EJK73468.1 hypothetical protein THAOC_04905 [Thalassiosira oceanica]
MIFVDEVTVDVPDVRLLEVDECGPAQLVLEVPVRADDADGPLGPASRRWRARRGFMPDVKRFAWGSASGGLAARIGRANGHPPERGRVLLLVASFRLIWFGFRPAELPSRGRRPPPSSASRRRSSIIDSTADRQSDAGPGPGLVASLGPAAGVS